MSAPRCSTSISTTLRQINDRLGHAVNLDADTTSDQDVLVAADIAMYDAKGAGGDRACVGGPVLRLS